MNSSTSSRRSNRQRRAAAALSLAQCLVVLDSRLMAGLIAASRALSRSGSQRQFPIRLIGPR